MDRDNFDNTINMYKERKPFRPFTVDLMNGVRLEVDFPGAILVRDGSGAHLGPGGVVSVFDWQGVARVFDGLSSPAQVEENGSNE